MKNWLPANKIIIVIGLLTIIAGLLRFTALNTPNEIAGDEVYFVNFARQYQAGELYYDVHPPLGKILIAAGIGVFGDNPFGWRFISALFGALLIPLMFFFGRTILRKDGIGLILACLVFFDGFFFSASRVGVMETSLLFFLFLGLTLVIYTIRSERLRWQLFLIAGISFGLALSIKWFTLVFLPVTALMLIFPDLSGWRQIEVPPMKKRLGYFFGLILAPAIVVYLLTWLAHFLLIGTAASRLAYYFWVFNIKMFDYHTHITDTSPLTSSWWSWPLTIQPWEYYHSVSGGMTRIISAVGTPVIWWSALVAFLPVVMKYLKRYTELLLVVIMFLIHWLPFALVNRPMFSYHFLISLPLFFLPLAFLLYRLWLDRSWGKGLVIAFFVLVIVNIIWLWPIWQGTPLDKDALQLRTWLPGWHRGP